MNMKTAGLGFSRTVINRIPTTVAERPKTQDLPLKPFAVIQWSICQRGGL